MSWRLRTMETAGSTDPEGRALQEEDDLLGKRPSRGEAVLRKLNAHLLPKFFLLTVLCYVDRCDHAPHVPGSSVHGGLSA
jgi:hypothetical protein